VKGLGRGRRAGVVIGAALLATVLGAVAAGSDVNRDTRSSTAGTPTSPAGTPAGPAPGSASLPPVSPSATGSEQIGKVGPVAGTGVPPFAFGTLETRTEHAAEESARGVKVAMLEVNWAAYEPVEGQFNAAYAQQTRDRVAALRAVGMQVTLGLGMHYTPSWILGYPDSRFVDQRGKVSNELNLVFNQRLRAKAERYLAQIDRDLGLENFWAVRLNTGGHMEVLYPGTGSYWAFDTNAQNGPDLPPTMAANPLPGWRPGNRSVSTVQVQRWADWYVRGLDDVVAWQMRFITALGFHGYFQLLTPGSGTRPDGYARDVSNYLPDGVTGVGAVWHRFYADLPD
jgi:hypothetical protein